MIDEIAAGGRFEVAFSFFAGMAGVSPASPDGEATVAIRKPSVRGYYEPTGTVAGQPVDVLAVSRSPVEGYTRISIRYRQGAEE